MRIKRFCAIIIIGAAALKAAESRAEPFTFAVGEWAPYISESAPGFGSHSQKIKDVFNAQGHDVRFEFLPWRRSLELTRRGLMPATFTWSYVGTRTRDFNYPKIPVDVLNHVYFFRKDRFPENMTSMTFEEIKERGLTVVGITDYWYQEPLEQIGVMFQHVATEKQAWTMLAHGRADIYIENDVVGRRYSRTILGDDASRIGMSEPIRVEPVYILFSKKHKDSARMLEIWDSQFAAEPNSLADPAIR